MLCWLQILMSLRLPETILTSNNLAYVHMHTKPQRMAFHKVQLKVQPSQTPDSTYVSCVPLLLSVLHCQDSAFVLTSAGQAMRQACAKASLGLQQMPNLCLICSLAGLSVVEGAIGWVGGVAGSAQGFGRVRHHPVPQLPAQAEAPHVADSQRRALQGPGSLGARCTAEHHLALQPPPQEGSLAHNLAALCCFYGFEGGPHSRSMKPCLKLYCCRLLTMNSIASCLAQALGSSCQLIDYLTACLFTGT